VVWRRAGGSPDLQVAEIFRKKFARAVNEVVGSTEKRVQARARFV
jgi:hypothetical protein